MTKRAKYSCPGVCTSDVSAVSDPHAIMHAAIIRRALQRSTSRAPGIWSAT